MLIMMMLLAWPSIDRIAVAVGKCGTEMIENYYFLLGEYLHFVDDWMVFNMCNVYSNGWLGISICAYSWKFQTSGNEKTITGEHYPEAESRPRRGGDVSLKFA